MTTKTANNLKICYLIIVIPQYTHLPHMLTFNLIRKEKKEKGKDKAKKSRKRENV